MISFLHNNTPKAILLDFGFIKIYYYGFIISLALILALLVSFYLGKKYYHIKKELILDLAFFLIIGGILGARLYDVFLEMPYYLQNPLDIIKLWQGGLAIHGAILAGALTLYLFAKKHKLSFLKISSLVLPVLSLGQALGRFGNYFNQELFGLPTKLPWGIPIELVNRPLDFLEYSYFHPTFLYESLACFLIFIILMYRHHYFAKKKYLDNKFYAWSIFIYMLSYSTVRFLLEFIRLDQAPYFLGLRWPQIMSLLLIIASFIFIIKIYSHALVEKKENK